MNPRTPRLAKRESTANNTMPCTALQGVPLPWIRDGGVSDNFVWLTRSMLSHV